MYRSFPVYGSFLIRFVVGMDQVVGSLGEKLLVTLWQGLVPARRSAQKAPAE